MQHLWQNLTQIMVTSEDAQAALLKIVAALGEAFQADCCLLTFEASKQTIYWSSKQTTLSHSQFSTLDDLELRRMLADVDLLSLVNPQTNTILPDWTLAVRKLVERFQSRVLQRQQQQLQYLLVRPTQFQGLINGAVILMRSQSQQWTELEMELLKTSSDSIAITIAQAQLQKQIHQKDQHHLLVDNLTQANWGGVELEQIFEIAVDGMVQTLQVSRGLLLLLKYPDLPPSDPSEHGTHTEATVVWESFNPKLFLQESHEVQESHEASESTPLQESTTCLSQSVSVSACTLCRQALTGVQKPIIIDVDFLQVADVSPLFNLEKMPTLIMMPLHSQGNVLGLLVLQHSQPRPWDQDEVSFVELVSAQLSTAIIQEQSLRQVQALVDRRTLQLQRSLEVQSKLYEKTCQQIDQLRHLNQVKDEFLSTVSHELLTPLTSMTLAIRMLRQSELPPERQATYLNILEQQCTQETELINDLLALQKLESGSVAIQLERIDLRYLVENLTQMFEKTWVDKGLTLSVDLPVRSLPIYINPDHLNRVLVELLTNAGKYAAPNTAVDFSTTYQDEQSAHQLVFTLSNLGSGISSEELPYIFDKFRRGRGIIQQAIQGTGLGLALVKCLVQHLSGTIVASSHPVEGTQFWKTTFVLTLPRSHLNSVF